MVLYWDASAVLSVLVEDEHSATAQEIARKKGIHFTSTLCSAETYAVLSRLRHEGALTNILYQSAQEVFESGPWRKIFIQPDWPIIKSLSSQYLLRGVDLWHMATVKTIQRELPEVEILTFDKKLLAVAEDEKIAVEI